MISAYLVPSALNAVFKFGRVALDAYEQKVRDEKILIPHSPTGVQGLDADIVRLFTGASRDEVTEPDGQLAQHWDSTNSIWKDNTESRAIIVARAKEILFSNDNTKKFSPDGYSAYEEYVALKQWGENKGPLSPLTRIGLALVDLVATYVSAYPEVMGLGNNSSRFTAALAKNISKLLPEYQTAEVLTPDDWAKLDFSDQIIMISMRAGLAATRETIDIQIKEEHFQKLFLNVTKPLVDKFSSNEFPDLDWQEVRDQLLDPMMQAGIKTVAANQQAFFGEDFDPDGAVGAITEAFLTDIVASKDGLLDILGETGAVKLYQAALGVVAERPELFRDGVGQSDKLARALITSSSKALLAADPVWRADFKALGQTLLISSIETINTNKSLILSTDKPLDILAASLFDEITKGIKIGADGQLDKFLTRSVENMLRDAMRSLLQQVSKQPQLLTGKTVREDVRKIVAAIAGAMVKDDRLLLTEKDWPEIVTVAVYEASRNPGRLFKLDNADPLQELGSKIISSLLTAAYEGLNVSDSQQDKFLLFGETLKNSIIVALQHAAGNAKAAIQNIAALETLVKNLNMIVKTRADELGAAEWQALFRKFISTALDQGKVDSFTVEVLNQLIDDGVRK